MKEKKERRRQRYGQEEEKGVYSEKKKVSVRWGQMGNNKKK